MNHFAGAGKPLPRAMVPGRSPTGRPLGAGGYKPVSPDFLGRH